MSEYYIASFSLEEDSLCHYGRPGMKWGQHIFGKEPSGRYTPKKRAKMVKKYGTKKAALKEARSIKNAYTTASATSIQKGNGNKYADSDRKEYKDTLKKLIVENTSDKSIIFKNLVLSNNLTEEMDKAYKEVSKHKDYFDEVEKYDGTKEKVLNEKGEKAFNNLTKDAWKMRDDAVKEWTKDLFGTDVTTISKKEYEETGAEFVSQMTTKDLEEMYDRYNYLEYLTKQI